MPKNRREREKEEMRELILQTAADIIGDEGIEKLSIRKIAGRIEYSPSIIYHYFKDKDEILNSVMQKGYKKIVTAVSSTKIESTSPEDRLKQMTKNYIEAALSMPEEFIAVQLNDSKEVLKHTSYLFKGASEEKTALAVLYNCLKEIYNEIEIDEKTIEMTAQMIAVSTLGLIIKLITERNIDNEQRQSLIEFFSNEIVLRIAHINKLE